MRKSINARAGNRAVVGLELSPKLIRGVRAGRNVGTVVRNVEPGREREELRAAMRTLGVNLRSDSIRVVLRGMPIASTRLLRIPPEEIASVSEYMPVPIRETVWDAIPFGARRTILLIAARNQVEATLDEWGINPTSAIAPEAVGLTTAALLALEPDLDGDGDMLWTESSGSARLGAANGNAERDREARRDVAHPVEATAKALLFKRRDRKFVDVEFHDREIPARFVVGTGAEEHAHCDVGAITIRPGGLPPEFAISWGATRWGVGDFTRMPNLEPKDRREYRARANAARRTQRLVASASIVMLAAAGAIQIPVAFAGNEADEERAVAESRKAASDSESEKLRAELESRIPPPRGPAGEMETILKAVIRFRGAIRIAEIRIERASSAFATLRKFDAGSMDNMFTITGDAESLESIESLRSELSRSGISSRVDDARKSARTPNTIDFRIKVP